jgi:DNA polymerase III epsilon subunit-like protein
LPFNSNGTFCHFHTDGPTRKKFTTWPCLIFRPASKRIEPTNFDVVKKLHGLLNQADIVIGHNSDKFDLKKVAARCIYHGLKPISPVKTIDNLEDR